MNSILNKVMQDLQLAGYGPRTVEAYSYHVKKFPEYYDKDPEHITEDEIKLYFLYLKNKKKLTGSASSQALKFLAKDQKYPGAEIGMIGILHTWTRAMIYHPHVHYLIPGSGLSENASFVRFSEYDFLVHVKLLSIIFKAKFRDALKELAGGLFYKIPARIWLQDWMVHIKPVGDGRKAIEYMGVIFLEWRLPITASFYEGTLLRFSL